MSKDGNINKGIDLKNYDDGGVSLREMKIGLWLSQNRRLLLKFLTGFLIVISALFYVYSTYHYVRYFLAGDPNDQILTNNLLASPRKITADLMIAPLQAFSAGEKTDLAIMITNPNVNFMATFRYCFRQGEREFACDDGFIMPAEEKYLLALGRELGNQTAGLSFNISEVFWRRIDVRKISDWPSFSARRLDFEVSEVDFLPGDRSGLSEKVSLNSLRFTLANNTAYGYYEAPIDILFFSGSDLVGVNRYLLANFLPGDKREIKLSWPGNLAGVTRTEIRPSINIMDDGVYLLYGGEANR